MLTRLVLSKLLVGAGAWPPLKLGEDRTLRGAMYAMYRSILCLPRGGNFRLHACTLRAKLSASSPCALLHASRLRYAAQMTRSAPDHLWAVKKADRPYCDLVLGSFTWLYLRIGKTTCMPDPLACWEPWRAVMTDAPGRFKGWIKRALALEKALMFALPSTLPFISSAVPGRPLRRQAMIAAMWMPCPRCAYPAARASAPSWRGLAMPPGSMPS